MRPAGRSVTGLAPLLHCAMLAFTHASGQGEPDGPLRTANNDVPFLPMVLVEAQLTAGEVLSAFHRDEPYLFLGAAFTTVGLVSAAMCLLRRRADALLLWMAVFAILYGQRLWLQFGSLSLTLQGDLFFVRFRAALDFLVPVPAFLFFQSAGFLGRWGRQFTAVLCIAFLALAAADLAGAPLGPVYLINNMLVVVALGAMVMGSLRRGPGMRDSRIVRGGLLCFAAAALWDNTVGTYLLRSKIEPFGFAIFLGALGYVAGRRLLERDRELSEIRQELELARKIQLSILPGAFPDSASFQVGTRYVPVTSVAGDFYDFLVTEGGHAGLLIADVSGHGVPAALIASMVKMAAAAQRAHASHPAQLLTEMNVALCGNTQGQYVTAAYLYLDAGNGELRYSAAGHPPLMLLRHGAVIDIVENGLLLAADAAATYSERRFPLESGDRLLLYTDGLIEARDTEGEMFGEESLIAALRETATMAPAEAAEAMVAEVQRWAPVQEDDLTVLVCDVLPALG